MLQEMQSVNCNLTGHNAGAHDLIPGWTGVWGTWDKTIPGVQSVFFFSQEKTPLPPSDQTVFCIHTATTASRARWQPNAENRFWNFPLSERARSVPPLITLLYHIQRTPGRQCPHSSKCTSSLYPLTKSHPNFAADSRIGFRNRINSISDHNPHTEGTGGWRCMIHTET